MELLCVCASPHTCVPDTLVKKKHQHVKLLLLVVSVLQETQATHKRRMLHQNTVTWCRRGRRRSILWLDFQLKCHFKPCSKWDRYFQILYCCAANTTLCTWQLAVLARPHLFRAAVHVTEPSQLLRDGNKYSSVRCWKKPSFLDLWFMYFLLELRYPECC